MDAFAFAKRSMSTGPMNIHVGLGLQVHLNPGMGFVVMRDVLPVLHIKITAEPLIHVA